MQHMYKTSQLGYIVFLDDKTNRCQPLYLTAYRAKRITRLGLGSEVMAFADAFGMA